MSKSAEVGPIRLALDIEDRALADRLAALLANVPGLQLAQPAEENKVMPALLWIAFWSSLMATAACFGEMSRAVSVDKPGRADAPDA